MPFSLESGRAEDQGIRRTMEDESISIDKMESTHNDSFFAVYDGHSGREAATYCKEHLHTMLLDLIDDEHRNETSAHHRRVPKSAISTTTSTALMEAELSIDIGGSGNDDDDDNNDNNDNNNNNNNNNSKDDNNNEDNVGGDLITAKRVNGTEIGPIARAFTRAFDDADRKVCSLFESAGCTAAVALVRDTTMHIAWAGDSRVVLGRRAGPSSKTTNISNDDVDDKKKNKKENEVVALCLTKDHKPGSSAETKRIEDAGGFVDGGMVSGVLSVARSIGDAPFKFASSSSEAEMKKVTQTPSARIFGNGTKGGKGFVWRENASQMVTSVPEVLSVSLDERDEFAVVACDGLYDVMSTEKVCAEAWKCVKKGMSPQEIARELVELALDYETVDNVSVIFVRFSW